MFREGKKADFYFIKSYTTLKDAIKLTCEYLPQIEIPHEIPCAFYQIEEILMQAIVIEELQLKTLKYGNYEYTQTGKLKKNYDPKNIDIKYSEVYHDTYLEWLISKNIPLGYYSRYSKKVSQNNNNFYKIPKDHKCVTLKTKALIETLLHFIDNESELHDAQSGVRESIIKYIADNNTHKIAETAINKEITPILNWTHK